MYSNSAALYFSPWRTVWLLHHITLPSTMFYKWLGDTSSLLAQLVLTNKKHPPSFIERLSIDIVVECIFPLLHVEEIICLRRVRFFFKFIYTSSNTSRPGEQALLRAYSRTSCLEADSQANDYSYASDCGHPQC